jgi:hypothetical protein
MAILLNEMANFIRRNIGGQAISGLAQQKACKVYGFVGIPKWRKPTATETGLQSLPDRFGIGSSGPAKISICLIHFLVVTLSAGEFIYRSGLSRLCQPQHNAHVL